MIRLNKMKRTHTHTRQMNIHRNEHATEMKIKVFHLSKSIKKQIKEFSIQKHLYTARRITRAKMKWKNMWSPMASLFQANKWKSSLFCLAMDFVGTSEINAPYFGSFSLDHFIYNRAACELVWTQKVFQNEKKNVHEAYKHGIFCSWYRAFV